MASISEIQNCIDNLSISSRSIDFPLLAAEVNSANSGISFTVATVDDLPDLETSNIGNGQIFFVDSIGVPVISSENAWKGLDGRVLRRDYNVSAIFSAGAFTGTGYFSTLCYFTREFCSATDWSKVSTGCDHGIALKTSGEIWSWGCNNNGQLGTGTNLSACSPVREFCSATDWCNVSTAGSMSIAIKKSGELWAWGCALCGSLGNGTTLGTCSPVQEFCSATNWCQASGGFRAANAIKTDGSLWTWGFNCCGQLGDGTTVDKCSPVRERSSSSNWCMVSMTQTVMAAAIKTDGSLWTWGCGCCGQLGSGNLISRCSPVREFCSDTNWCQTSGRYATKTDGSLWGWGLAGSLVGCIEPSPFNIICSPVRESRSATDWCKIDSNPNSCGAAALKTSGELWVWGPNGGRFGLGTCTSTVLFPTKVNNFPSDWSDISLGPTSLNGIQNR